MMGFIPLRYAIRTNLIPPSPVGPNCWSRNLTSSLPHTALWQCSQTFLRSSNVLCSVGLRNLLAQQAAPAITSGTAPGHCHQLCVLTAWTLTGAQNRSDDLSGHLPGPSSLHKGKYGFRVCLHLSPTPAVQDSTCSYMG